MKKLILILFLVGCSAPVEYMTQQESAEMRLASRINRERVQLRQENRELKEKVKILEYELDLCRGRK